MNRSLRSLTLFLALWASAAVWAQMGPGGPGAGGPPPGGEPGGGSGGGPGAGGRGGQASRASSKVGRVAMTEIPLTAKVGGRLTPVASVSHAASSGGFVRSIFVRVGQKVSSGDRLFSVERENPGASYVPATILARIDGIVSSISVAENQAVKSGDQGVLVIDPGAQLLNALLSDKDAGAIREGMPVTATVVGGEVLKGSVVSRSPEPDYKTGLYSLTLRFPDAPPAGLGRFATVELPIGKVRGIFVQQDLLQRMYGRYQLWVVNPEGLLETRRVTIGAIYGDQVLIEDGLKAGERILLKRSGKEKAGSPAEE